jgi:hypothetical protein
MGRKCAAGIAAASVVSGLAITFAGISGGSNQIAASRSVDPTASAASVGTQPAAAKQQERVSSPRRPKALEVYAYTSDGRCVQTGFASWAINTTRCIPSAGRSTTTRSRR